MLIPPPRVHRHRYHGVLAPNGPWRAQVAAMAAGTSAQVPSEVAACLPAGRSTARTQDRAAETVHRTYASSLWAVLLVRIYEVFPLVYPHCGAPMRILAFVTDTASVTHILRHLGEPTQPPRVAPARGPPESAVPFDQSPAFDPEATRAGAGLPIRPDPELAKPRNGACPQRERQRSRSSPGTLHRNPPATQLGPARPAFGSQIRPADRPRAPKLPRTLTAAPPEDYASLTPEAVEFPILHPGCRAQITQIVALQQTAGGTPMNETLPLQQQDCRPGLEAGMSRAPEFMPRFAVPTGSRKRLGIWGSSVIASHFRLAALALFGSVTWAGSVNAQPPEDIGTSQQPLVVIGSVVDADTRERFGLLTLTAPGTSCSASMLNDYWAITAAHCVFSTAGTCPQFATNQVQLTANWPRPEWAANTKTVTVRRIITYGTPVACPNTLGTPNDIAILQVGLRDFGRSDIRERKLGERAPVSNSTVRAYGRGINSLAFITPTGPSPTTSDGQYRTVDFGITSISPAEFSFFGGNGASVAGGDSGGPTLFQDWDNPSSPRRRLEWRLIGVHSRCAFTCLPGQSCNPPNPWPWVFRVDQCWDASVFQVRDAILAAIQERPADDSFVGRFPDSVLATRRALYAVNIDEPLVAPPDAAIDVQLTFESCHALRFSQGCPVEAVYEIWAYDASQQQILHTDSGKCLNISGARHDAGAPIILHPCSGAPNEKWAISGTSTWTIKSTLTGLCLHASPGESGGGSGLTQTLPVPATLTQMPCDGSSAQQFSNVDADWVRRNGPH